MVCFCLPVALLALRPPLFAQIASTYGQIDRFAALRGLGATSLARHNRSRHLIGIVPQRSGQLRRAPWSSAGLSLPYQKYQRAYRPLLRHIISHIGGTHMRKHLLTVLSQESLARIPIQYGLFLMVLSVALRGGTSSILRIGLCALGLALVLLAGAEHVPQHARKAVQLMRSTAYLSTLLGCLVAMLLWLGIAL
jgi:hypothetical protein